MFSLGPPKTDRLRTSMSFGASSSIHAILLLWLVIGSARIPHDRRSLYDQEIRPFEKHLVWYNLREKLPDIKPAPDAPALKRPRAIHKFHQTLVSGPKDDSDVPQMIRSQAPPAELPRPLPLPNMVAEAAPPPKYRIFLPPPDMPPKETAPPVLPDSPAADPKLPIAATPLVAVTPRPKPLPFRIPPPKKKRTSNVPPPQLPDAPQVAEGKSQAAPLSLGASARRPRPLPMQVPPPLEPRRSAAPITLPEAPRVESAASVTPSPKSAPLGAAMPRPGPRSFQGPPPLPSASASSKTAPALPDAPAVSANSAPGAPGTAPRIPRRFSAPQSKAPKEQTQEPAIANPAPAVSSPDAVGTASLVIAGLNPSALKEIPEPPPSHAAGFSGGPEPRLAIGEAAANEKASVVVPSLTAGGGSRDSLPTVAPRPEPSAAGRLLAELRDPLAPNPSIPFNPYAPKPMRVSTSPDPRMRGRVVYTMAIQMPNVTSYSGSWMVWYAERVPEPGVDVPNVRPPLPRHKVDPAYVRSAVDDRIEGIVRLAAVIGKDGGVSQIEILSGLDNRLDRSAEEALAKWLFEPALRDGAPIDVDAVFEVPFRLAPKPSR